MRDDDNKNDDKNDDNNDGERICSMQEEIDE
jgi:hypothetical protein